MSDPRPDDSTRPANASVAPRAMEDARRAEEPKGQPFGRYDLLAKLGEGGMGEVWKAWDTQLKRVVALKRIRPDKVMPGTAERFVREAQAGARLQHPNIIRVFDNGIVEGHHYITTEYIEGESLDKAIAAQPPHPKMAIELMKQVAEALAYAHDQGIVHRDVKPANILVDTQRRAFVMDFGLAKDMRGELGRELTASGYPLGTLLYMSPEQANGWTEALGPPCDQFAVGVVLYELLTGKRPFGGNSQREILNAIVETDPVPPTRENPRLDNHLGGDLPQGAGEGSASPLRIDGCACRGPWPLAGAGGGPSIQGEAGRSAGGARPRRVGAPGGR